MAITTVYTYPLDGSMKDFNVPFEYLARRFVVLTLIGRDRKELVLTSDYRFTSKTSVQTTKAWGPADGYDWLEIRRNTSATDRLVDFADGSILRASDLNASQVQTLHVAEEARNMVADTIAVNNDGDLDARGRRLVNLADAVHDGDAVTLRQERTWAGSALNQADRAKTEADRATTQASAASASASASKTSETNSKASESAAKLSETNSKASENAAKLSETKSKTSETNAQSSAAAAADSATSALAQADRAKTEADRAQTEADKLANVNAFAALLGETTEVQASFKDEVTIQMGKKGRYYGLINVQNPGMNDSGNNGHWSVGGNAPTLRFLNSDNTQVRFVNWAPGDGTLRWGGPSDTRGSFVIDQSGAAYIYGGLRAKGNTTVGGLRVNAGDGMVDSADYASISSNILAIYGDGNSHLWFRRRNGTERNLIFSDAAAVLHIRANESDIATFFPDGTARISGAVLYVGANSRYAQDGNIYGSVWGNRYLSDWLRDPGWEAAGATTIMAYNNNGGHVGPGAVLPGTALKWSSHNSIGDFVNFGQWKCCGNGNQGGVTLWRRVG